MNEYKLWLAKIVTVAVVLLVGLPVLSLMISAAGSASGTKVSVIELEGPIMDATEVLTALYKHAADKDVKAIVLRIDSPGGAVAPSEEIYNAVRRLKAEKPIVVSMGSVAASGGLYASLAGSKIFAQEGTQTGSIGVILQLPNFASVADKVGFSMVTVKSGSLKDTGNPFRAMTDDERRFLEDTASKVHGSFIRAVSTGRNIPEEKVRKFADGRLILGLEAKELGLIDEFGDIYDAARASLALAGVTLEPDQVPALVYANKKKGFLSKVLEGRSALPELVASEVAAMRPVMQYLAF